MRVRTVLEQMAFHEGIGLDQDSLPTQTLVKETGIGFTNTIKGTHLDIDSLFLLVLEKVLINQLVFVEARTIEFVEVEVVLKEWRLSTQIG